MSPETPQITRRGQEFPAVELSAARESQVPIYKDRHQHCEAEERLWDVESEDGFAVEDCVGKKVLG
jgi:hypothetical protein